MAQDSNARPVRPDEAYSRDQAAAGRNNDPLAELARLIGQDDPFAGTGRQGAAAGGPQQGRDDHAEQYDQAAYDAHYGRHDEAQYAHDQQYEQGQYAEDYYDDGQTYAEEGYQEPAAPKRRGGLTIVAAVVGLAVLGTAGVYGYRTFTGPSATSGEPPVIKAEQTPMKVVPPAPTSDPQAPKAYTPGGPDRGERVVPREEQPVDPRSFAKAAPPAPPAAGGSVLPPLGAPAPSPAATAGGSEPKKVKTVAIRPDQPQGVPTQPAAPAQPPARMAAVPPAAAPAPAAPAAPHPAAATGGYVVQVASQRSESDAQASFKALQQKYPSVLGSHQAMVRRADLGDKGVYYRVQIGPFAADQAKELCSSLKGAGGQCVVQPN